MLRANHLATSHVCNGAGAKFAIRMVFTSCALARSMNGANGETSPLAFAWKAAIIKR